MSLHPALQLWNLDTQQQGLKTLDTFHICCLKRSLGLQREDGIPHTEILKRSFASYIEAMNVKHLSNWASQVVRTDDSRFPRIAM